MSIRTKLGVVTTALALTATLGACGGDRDAASDDPDAPATVKVGAVPVAESIPLVLGDC